MTFQCKILYKLLNKEFALWSIFSKKPLRNKKNQPQYFPCITLSRETGSGGRLIAKLVSQKLGLKYYDKKIVELIVKNTQKRKELIESFDEKTQNLLIETIETLFGEAISGSTYFHNLVKVILSLASKESCVILGRGGNFIIPKEANLRVRIIAPLKVRIKNSNLYEKNTLKQASQRIKEIHFQRKDFIQKYFNKNVSNANYYDLVINTENIALEEVVDLIAEAYKKKFPSNKLN